ncbi:MAG: hypothetical protein IKT97_07720 [Spirochaetia bacterium]|nr:hypothetical protein [Spirochaetia bacterium]
MNLNELAESDLALTVEDDVMGGATGLTLIHGDDFYLVNGIMGDIGYLLDTEGNAVSGRSVVFAYRMKSLRDGNDEMILPQKGWAASYEDLHRKTWKLFVSRVEPDRTLGVCRLVLCMGDAE